MSPGTLSLGSTQKVSIQYPSVLSSCTTDLVKAGVGSFDMFNSVQFNSIQGSTEKTGRTIDSAQESLLWRRRYQSLLWAFCEDGGEAVLI